jgi:hypothetical protein
LKNRKNKLLWPRRYTALPQKPVYAVLPDKHSAIGKPPSALTANATNVSIITGGLLSAFWVPAQSTPRPEALATVACTLYASPALGFTEPQAPLRPAPGSTIDEYGAIDTRYWRHSFNLNRRHRDQFMEMIEAPLDLSMKALEIQIEIPAELLAPLDPATHKEVLNSAKELFYSDAIFLDLYLKKQLMLQTGYVAKSIRDLTTDFTPLDTIKDTPEMKELALYYQEIGAKYKSDVTRIFISLVEFQKQTHLKSILLLVVQSIFWIFHSHIRQFTSKNVLQKTGYADFDDSEDNTDATAKLEDKEVRKVRKGHQAGFATLFLITNLYGILWEYCYPHSNCVTASQ